MYKSVLNHHIEKLKKELAGKSLIIYKGFPPLFIKTLSMEFNSWNIISYVFSENLFIDPNKLEAEKNKLLSNLLAAEQDFLILPYEICYPVSEIIDLSVLNRKMFICQNTLFQQYPKTLPIPVKDIENELELTGSDETENQFNTFYANSMTRFGLDFVEYADLPEKMINELVAIEFADSVNYRNLQIDDIEEEKLENRNHIVFKSSDSSYDKFKYELFWDEFKSDLLLVLEELPDTNNQEAKRELDALIYLFSHSEYDLSIGIIQREQKDVFRSEFSEILKFYWGSDHFRSINFYKNPAISTETHNLSQGTIIEEIVRQTERAHNEDVYKDIFLTAPTGSGKSVLFQVPALYLAENHNLVTIVVSPLKALMKDQVEGLNSRGVFTAAYINSDISLIERNNIIEAIESGEISILYMSPELLLSYTIEHFIGERKIGLLVIDEAHLVTTWGRDFRVDYWFLGNYIKKMRKYYSSKFPVLAVTATAVYGGPDDLVFETVESLNMQMRQLFIGNIRRSDIEFKINQIDYKSGYEEERKKRTIDQVKHYIDNDIKAIIYFPWTNQIREIHLSLEEIYRHKVRQYYGQVYKEIRAEVLEGFRDGNLKVVLATKAFGMGVDVSDIEEVYHHAPSGNLSDYIQEIGRVARREDIHGIARVDYSSKDLKYTKILYGLSAIRQWHVSNVLQKLNRIYKLKKSRNFLVSVEDFKHIFSDQLDDASIEQKVKSSLLLIERDLLGKYKYNVIIVRPKALFSTVYLKVKSDKRIKFLQKYGKYADEVEIDRREKTVYVRGAEVKRKDNRRIYQFRLNNFWEDELSKESFPKIKRDFFEGELFGDLSDGIIPQHRLRISLSETPKNTLGKMLYYFSCMEQAFLDLGSGFFSKRELSSALKVKIENKALRDRIADLLTAIFSTGRPLQGRNRFKDDLCFLQKKRDGYELKYRVYSNQYTNIKERIERQYAKMFFFDGETTYEDYITIDPVKSKIYHDIAYLIESFDLGTFEFDGGQTPHLFIRINDPNKVEYLLHNNYDNEIIRDIKKRHDSSMQIMEHFFMTDISSNERWDFVERYFLGFDLFEENGELSDD